MNDNEIKDTIQYGSKEIEYIIRRSQRKTLAINVEPNTSVSVIAPFDATITAIREKVKKRSSWIIRQQIYFTDFLPLMPKKEYMSGESFRYLGRQYRLKLIEAEKSSIKIIDRRLLIEIKDKNDKARVQEIIENWYLAQAKHYFSNCLNQLWHLFAEYNRSPPSLIVRKMLKRWGSYTQSGKILLNVELIQAPSHCIEYVIVHELCHIFCRDHGSKFFALLEKIMPDWQMRKEKLEEIYL